MCVRCKNQHDIPPHRDICNAMKSHRLAIAALLVASACRGQSADRESNASKTASIATPIASSREVPSANTTSAPSASATAPFRENDIRPSADPVPMVIVQGGTLKRCRVEPLDLEPTCSNETFTVASFVIDTTEVTVGVYRRCVEAGTCTAVRVLSNPATSDCNWDPARFGRKLEEPAQHPANCITFQQANAYCHWAGKRLPTSDEWEAAARAPDARTYPWGTAPAPDVSIYPIGRGRNKAPDNAYVACWRNPGTCRVGTDTPTPLGLRDMAGNVSEWTSDAACQMPRQCKSISPERRKLDYRLVCGTSHQDPVVDEAGLLWLALCAPRLATDQAPRVGFRCARDIGAN